MPRIAFAFVIAMLAVPAAAADSEWTVILVVDGDTVKVDSEPDLPRELAVLSVRVRGVDTPETGHRAKCEAERQAGQTASDFARRRVEAAERVVVRNPQWGKWGGRVIAELMLDGEPLAGMLIAAGLGRPYAGGRRQSWCD